jgi:hypothetical protein
MKWLVIQGANLTLAEGQDEYETIKVRRDITEVWHGDTPHPVPCMVAEIKPSPEDLERLANGGSLYLQILGQSWPPVAITTVDPALTKPSGNA